MNRGYRRLALSVLVGLFAATTIFLAIDSPKLVADEKPKPTKEALIKVLRAAQQKLESNNLTEAAQHFVLPPNFKPEMLAGLVEKREISKAGVDVLAAKAVFGTATERFGADRAKALATKASKDAANCYGFYHESEGVTAEVMAVWENNVFKLVRLDDVGKLRPINETK